MNTQVFYALITPLFIQAVASNEAELENLKNLGRQLKAKGFEMRIVKANNKDGLYDLLNHTNRTDIKQEIWKAIDNCRAGAQLA